MRNLVRFLRCVPPARQNPTIQLDGGPLGHIRVNEVSFEDSREGPTVVELSLPRDNSTWVRAWVGTPTQVADWIEGECDAPETANAVRAGAARRVGWLEWIGVSKSKQRIGGYGQVLLTQILRRFDELGADEVWLEAGKSKQSAEVRARLRRWYERNGFSFDPVGEGRPVMLRRRPSGP